MNFTTRVLGTFGTHILTFIFVLLTSIVVARCLGPEGKGIFTLVLLVPTLLVVLSNLGVGLSNNYHSASGKYKLSALVGNSFVLAGIIGVIISAAFILFWHFSPFDLFPEVSPLYAYVILAAVPFNLLNLYLAGILFGKLKIRQINLAWILGGLVNLVGAVVILLALKQGILSLILLAIAVQVITSLLYIIILRGMTQYSLRFEPGVFKGTIGYGVKGYVANTSTFLHYRVDQFMVGYFVGATQLGYYAVAVPLAELLVFIPRAISSILFPEVAGSTSERAAKLCAKVSRCTVLISLLLCLLFAVGARVLVGVLYGKQFLSSVTPLLILLPGVLLIAISDAPGSYIGGTGRVIFNTYGALGSLAVNIGLNLLLIPRMGIAGAALATTISYSLHSIYTAIVFLVLSKKSLSQTFIPKRQDMVDLWKLAVRDYRGAHEFVNQRLGNYRK